MKWLQNFMRGRYGVDQFSFALLILSFIIMISSTLFRWDYAWFIALLPLGYCYFRILSRNPYKRAAENSIFMGKVYPITNTWKRKKGEFQNRKTYKYYTCKQCKQRLRVPKGKGTLTITCPKCKSKFDKRT